MAVDSREKGKRGEMQIRDKLREKTQLQWERVPGSGAFGQNHGLKGDVYLPHTSGKRSLYCLEVKWYKDEQVTSNILNVGESQVEKWWEQTIREAEQMHMKPALIFKKDRGDWLVALDANDLNAEILMSIPYIMISKKDMEIVIGKFDPWLYHLDIGELVA
ncbi:tRNA endonuclease-like protein [Serratia phage vB_SmaM-Kamaji]|nr:tRNA endonuclease-like protein [Serratia phage vB_SmaM-Kamaji]